MDRDKAKKAIKVITLIWVLLGLALAGLVLSKLIDLTLFQYLFPGGLILYAVIVSILAQIAQKVD